MDTDVSLGEDSEYIPDSGDTDDDTQSNDPNEKFNLIIALINSISTSLCVILTLFEFAMNFYFSQCHTNYL